METERKIVAEPVGDSEGGFSSGSRTTIELPPYAAGEFRNLVDPKGRAEATGGDSAEAVKAKVELKAHMKALLGIKDGDDPF